MGPHPPPPCSTGDRKAGHFEKRFRGEAFPTITSNNERMTWLDAL